MTAGPGDLSKTIQEGSHISPPQFISAALAGKALEDSPGATLGKLLSSKQEVAVRICLLLSQT